MNAKRRQTRHHATFTKHEDRGFCAHCGQWVSMRGRFVGRQMVAFLNRLRAAQGALVTHTEMTEYLWGDDPEGGPLDPRAILGQYVFHLRNHGYPIMCFYGVGYRFAPTFTSVIAEPEEIAA